MDTQERIELRQPRDFGENFNTSVKFLRQNFRPLLRCILAHAGPLILISAVCERLYDSNMEGGSPFTNGYYIGYLLFSIAGYLALISSTFCYMILYKEKGKGNFDHNDVRNLIAKNTWKIIGAFFWFVVLVAVYALGILFVGGIIYAVNSALLVFLSIFSILGLCLIFPPILWRYTVFYIPIIEENMEVMAAAGKTKELIQSQFWWTWLYYTCCAIINSVLGVVFMLPIIIYQLVILFAGFVPGSDSSPVYIATAIFCSTLSSFVSCFLFVSSAMYYYSQAEKKDPVALMERIDDIGKKTNTLNEQSF